MPDPALAGNADPCPACELRREQVDTARIDRPEVDCQLCDGRGFLPLSSAEIVRRTDAEGPRKGRARVPMNAGLKAALLQARRAALTDHVIEWAGEPVRSIKTGFRAALETAGCEGCVLHGLRKNATIELIEAGCSEDEIMAITGHATSDMIRLYGRGRGRRFWRSEQGKGASDETRP